MNRQTPIGPVDRVAMSKGRTETGLDREHTPTPGQLAYAWLRNVRAIYRRGAEVFISVLGIGLLVWIAWRTVEQAKLPDWTHLLALILIAVLHYVVRIWATGRENSISNRSQSYEWQHEELQSGNEILFFARALTRPKKTFSRIKEAVKPLTRAHEVTTKYWLEVPPAATRSGFVRVPLLVPRKGTLFDDMHIVTSGGAEVPTLTFPEAASYCLSVMREIAVTLDYRVYQRYIDCFEDDLSRYVLGKFDEENPGSRERWLGRLEEALGDSPLARLVMQMAAILISSYPIVACVPTARQGELQIDDDAGERLPIVVETRHRHVLPRVNPPGRIPSIFSWLIDLPARTVGLRPLGFEYPLDRSIQTMSYHLEFFGPEGTYLFRQGFPKRFLAKRFDYHIFRRRLGQRYAHLYCRGADDSVRGQKVRFTFRERPPGSLGTSAATALAAFIIITTSAVHFSASASAQVGGVHSLLLAFPAVAAAWLGMDRPSMLFGGSSAARWSNVLTLLISTLALLLSLGVMQGEAASRWIAEWTPSGGLFSLEPAWSLLVVAAALIATLFTYLWISEAYMYTRFLRRETAGMDNSWDELV